MTDEPRIRTTLDDRAASLEVPAPPLPDIVARGRRAARRRGLAAAGAASLAVAACLALVAVLTGVPDAGRSAPPAGPAPEASSSPPAGSEEGVTFEELPEGPAPTSPFVIGKELHVDGARVTLGGDERLLGTTQIFGLQRGTNTIMGIDQRATLYRFHPTDPQIISEDAEQVVVSSGDDVAAWVVHPAAVDPVVVAWDLSRQRELGRVEFVDSDARCCDNPFMLESVDSDGRVIAMTATQGWTWRPGMEKAPQKLRWTDGRAFSPSSYLPYEYVDGGIVVQDQETLEWLRLELEDDGTLQEAESVRADHAAWSPDAQQLITIDELVRGHVVTLTVDGSSTEVGWPNDVDAGSRLVWESETTFLLDASAPAPDYGELGWVRCHTDDLTCERIPESQRMDPVQ